MENRLNINTITEDECREILKFVYPDEDNFFVDIIRSTKNPKECISIKYLNDITDGCRLDFTNTKCVQWLYEHNYEIGALLKENAYFSQQEIDYDNKMYSISCLLLKKDLTETPLMSDYVRSSLQEILDKYYNEEYI